MLMSLDRLLNKVCGSVGEIQENASFDGIFFHPVAVLCTAVGV